MPSDPDRSDGFPENKKKWPKIIAFDTSGPFVSIGMATESYSSGQFREMARGQAEVLFPMLEEALSVAEWAWADIDAIGVGVGPGNFTGIRISVSAARGLGLALGIPVFGLTSFQIAYGSHDIPSGVMVSLPGPRDFAYVQGFGIGGQPQFGPGRLIDPADPTKDLQISSGMEVQGYRAREIASHFEAAGFEEPQTYGPERLAEMTEFMYLDASAFPPPPKPQYIKPADAAPPRDAPPVILDDA